MTCWHDLERHAGRAAFVPADGGTIDYAALARAADATFDLPRGAPVLLALDNHPAAMIAYLGALRRGLPAIVTAGDDTAADRERVDRRGTVILVTALVAALDGRRATRTR